MPPEAATGTRASDLDQIIERQIMQRTWGRIHRLQVELIGDRVFVHGCTSSYYSKQLALEGVLDVIGPDAIAQVELDIQVAGRPPSAVNTRMSPVRNASA